MALVCVFSGPAIAQPAAEPQPATPATPAVPATPATPATTPKPDAEGAEAAPAERGAGPAAQALRADGAGSFSIRRGDYSMTLTGLVQIWGTPYLGSDALVENDDPSTETGFRARRVRFGAYGGLPEHFNYRLYFELFDDVAASTVDGRPVGARLRDALIGWDRFEFANVVIGAGKVPFSRGNLTPTSEIALPEDAFTIKRLGIDRRVGLSVSGAAGPLSYGAGIFNADPSLSFGNRADGLLGAGRVEFSTAAIGYSQSTLGAAGGKPMGFSVGGGATLQKNGAQEAWSAGGDLAFRHERVVATGELLYSKTKPLAVPVVPGGVPVEVPSLGGYFTLAVAVIPKLVEVAGRIEYFDANTKIDDENDLLLISGGATTAFVDGRVKVGLQYQSRGERHGRSLANDAVLGQVLAQF